MDLRVHEERRRHDHRRWGGRPRGRGRLGHQVVAIGHLLELVEPPLTLLFTQHPRNLHLGLEAFLEAAVLAALPGAENYRAAGSTISLTS